LHDCIRGEDIFVFIDANFTLLANLIVLYYWMCIMIGHYAIVWFGPCRRPHIVGKRRFFLLSSL
jgi:hypothetical protein